MINFINKKNKGFMLAEIVVVATVIMVILVALFTTVNRVLIQRKKREGYSTVDAIYAAESLSKRYNFYSDDYKLDETTPYKKLTDLGENEHEIKRAYVIKYNADSLNKFINESSEDKYFLDYVSFLKNNVDFNLKYISIVILEINNEGKDDYGYYYIKQLNEYSESDFVTNNSSRSHSSLVPYPPNPPDLSMGLTAVTYDEDEKKWLVIDEKNEEEEVWYDYDNQKWANAVLLKNNVEPGHYLDLEDDVYAMFVWIPRFSYTIGCKDLSDLSNASPTTCLGYKIEKATDLSIATPGAIDIKFVKNTIDETKSSRPVYSYTDSERNPSNWMTHPAFNRNGKKLSGIWVGKFNVGINKNSDTNCYSAPQKYCSTKTDKPSNPLILPDQRSINYLTPSMFSDTVKIFGTLGIKSTGNIHVMTNSEWGAVAYFSQSIYGKYGNSNYLGDKKAIYVNNSYYDLGQDSGFGFEKGKVSFTGRSMGDSISGSYVYEGYFKYNDINANNGNFVEHSGTGASTTGNIYGIYDMVMGNHVMANIGDYTGTTGGVRFNGIKIEKASEIDNIGKDINIYDRTNTKLNVRVNIGQATFEVGTGPYYEYAGNVSSNSFTSGNWQNSKHLYSYWSGESSGDSGNTTPWYIRGTTKSIFSSWSNTGAGDEYSVHATLVSTK